MDGTGVPVVKKETVGRRQDRGQPAHTREAKLGCVFTQTTWDKEGYPIRDPDSPPTPEPSRVQKSLVVESMGKPGDAAGAAHSRRS